jgi:3-hydroxybutyryl-CoA dehydrogenase
MTAGTVLPRLGVVGCGAMGGGLAEAGLIAGLDVVVLVSAPDRAGPARARLRDALDRAVAKGRLTEDAREQAEDRLEVAADPDLLADRQWIVEAVVEDHEVKRRVFGMLDRVVEADEAVLASTTSSLRVQDLADGVRRPGRVIGMHFFNPVPVMPLVEVVRSAVTSEPVARRAEEYAERALGKQIIRALDRPGFVVNALLVPYLLAAVRMYESGVASAADIDRGMTLGCGHPMGPLALLDLIGLDTITDVAALLHRSSQDPAYAVPPLLTKMVDAGELGRKSRQGFFPYDTVRGGRR